MAAEAPQLLADEMRRQLNDGIDSDRGIHLLLDSYGLPLAGNLAKWTAIDSFPTGTFSRDVVSQVQSRCPTKGRAANSTSDPR